MTTQAKDYNLIKYLCWKPDIQHAADWYKGLQQWRQENSCAFDDSILLEKVYKVIEKDKMLQEHGGNQLHDSRNG